MRCGLQDHLGSLLRNHVDCAGDKKSRNAREHGRVHNAQAACAMHPKVALKNSVVFPRSNRTTRRSVMSPGVLTDECLQVIVRLYSVAWQFLLRNELAVLEVLRDLAHESYAFDNRIEILSSGVAALFEVAKVDRRHVSRVCRPQAHFTRSVVRMRLEHDPCEVVQVLGEERRVGGEISAK